MDEKRVHYHSYLQLDKILSAQTLESEKAGRPAHDEMLFITTHQTYEIWFKQMIYEIDSILEIFSLSRVDEKKMGFVVSRLNRVIEILKVLFQQIGVIETMTPLDFLDFRDLLFPASGFQSFQFRVFENKLGLDANQRLPYNHMKYHEHFDSKLSESLKETEGQKSLFHCTDDWLSRTPFLQSKGFDFWESYRTAVQKMFEQEKSMINRSHLLAAEEREKNLNIVKDSEETFSALFDEDKYNELRKQGHWRLSYKAVHAALLIQLYRDQPVFQLPFRFITTLLDLDALMTNWRYRHALMAKRMLGSKVGTGGSSGAKYLRESTEQHKIFSDFFQLTSFFIPRSNLPELPKEMEERLGFSYESEK